MLNSGSILQSRYQILQRIGGGGMGDVYLAADLRLGNQRVVVKENRGGNPQLFYSEASILAALSHPNMPRVMDHFVDASSGAQYLVMDYIAGQSLQQWMLERGPLPEAQALSLMSHIFDAVKYLHTNHVIHRDIKPQNIIITPDGKAALVDFGIAKVMRPGQATVTAARGFGSPGYAPPEQYTGGTDERSDVFSLGGTLFYALTATDPPSAPELAYGKTLPSVRKSNASVSANTDRVIHRAMALAGNQRFQTVAEMEQALKTRPMIEPRILIAAAGGAAIFLLLMLAFFARENITHSFIAMMASVTPTATDTATPTLTPTVTLTFTPTSTATATLVPPTSTPTATATTRVTPTPRAGETRVVNDAPMVFVPAGKFLMGSNDGDSDEKPVHTVYLDSFWIDKFAVTNVLYKKCVDVGKCQPLEIPGADFYVNPLYTNYPVLYVSWYDANTYCEWSAKRLPTEAEWEKAARGTDGWIYPWGNDFDPNRLNYFTGGPTKLKEVGSYPSGASPYGALDMAGNAPEWVADWYDSNYYRDTPDQNPQGPPSGNVKVRRGGGYFSFQRYVRAASRDKDTPGNRLAAVGFRCAQ